MSVSISEAYFLDCDECGWTTTIYRESEADETAYFHEQIHA